VIIGAEEHKLGIRGSSTVGVQFDRARVERSCVLGPGGRGMYEAHRALAWGRTVMASGCVGTGQAALDATIEFVRARAQFGKPIASFGATQAHLARMAATLFAMRALVRTVSAREDHGEPIEVESMLAKVFCSEGAFDLCDTAVQLHGALGFIEPVGVARLLRDCRITRIFEGANDVLLVRAGLASLSGHHRPSIQNVRTSTDVSLLSAAVECERFGAELDATVARTRKAHGVRVVSHQLVLQRVARAAIAHAAAVAAIEEALGDGEALSSALACEAVAHCVRSGRAALASVDHADEEEAMARALLATMDEQSGGQRQWQ
jgi:alkylation response protein AidB-like acyl-CoA dehydrogenase